MAQKHECPCREQCLLQRVMDTIGGKWKLPILLDLIRWKKTEQLVDSVGIAKAEEK